nr:hypothetical protein [Snuella sedimenti]
MVAIYDLTEQFPSNEGFWINHSITPCFSLNTI